MSNIFNPNYIISIKSIDIDSVTTYSSILFRKDFIYVAARLPLSEDKPVQIDGKTSYEAFVELMKNETDSDTIHEKASEIVQKFGGQVIGVLQLKNLVAKNGFFSKGLYMRENIDTFKKYNKVITGGGKQLYTELKEFYKDFKPMDW